MLHTPESVMPDKLEMHFSTAEDAAHFETTFLDVDDVYVRWYVTLRCSRI